MRDNGVEKGYIRKDLRKAQHEVFVAAYQMQCQRYFNRLGYL
jgi:hypothetical protein